MKRGWALRRGTLGILTLALALSAPNARAEAPSDDVEADAEEEEEAVVEPGAEEDAAPANDSDSAPAGDETLRDGAPREEPVDPNADPDAPPVIRAVPSNRHMLVKARSLRLTEAAAERLLRIAKRYHERTGKQLVITGGDRGADRQAALMYKKLTNGEDLLALYARDDLVRPIVDAYDDGKRADKTKKAITRAMSRVIEAQMAEGHYVSRHLDFTAADVRSRDMTPEQVEEFVAIVKAEPFVHLVDERKSASPCFHLGM